MEASTGTKAWIAGDFLCIHCDERVHVAQGGELPPCPNCGYLDYAVCGSTTQKAVADKVAQQPVE